MHAHEIQAALVDAVRTHGLAVVATAGASGRPEAALVGIAAADGGELLFNAPRGVRKESNLASNPRVAVVIGWTDDLSFQVEGEAESLEGEARAAAALAYEAQHPGSRASHPDFLLYRIRPTWIRRYDAAITPPVVAEHGIRAD